MTGAIAVLNSGSSSVKFQLYRAGQDGPAIRGQAEGIHTSPKLKAVDAAGTTIIEGGWVARAEGCHGDALDRILAFLREELRGAPLQAVGHRVVHGGLAHAAPVRVTPRVLAELEALAPLAPLHQPNSLLPIWRLLDRAPEVPQVACFDTAFHRTQPEVAQMFGLPYTLHEAGVRRFGFHGLSYESVAQRLPALDARAARGRTVVLHLGNGASMCALLAGRSVATTMGFTALDGLLMGTRSGSLDPGAVLYLLQSRGMDAKSVEKLLYQESGLLGVSGISPDMRTLLASAKPRAQLAIDLYVYRVRRELGALAAVLGGLDALVFTGGIGENSAVIRERVCRDAAWLGVEIDPGANEAGAAMISAAASPVRAWRLASDEEGVIARHARALTEGAPASTPARA